ncbi:hypothetical protein TWF569_010995 [Orbilia oligospora]|uniref:DASH complex subunit DUO1 n=1 Tax=Orbilia oligospora TaxID=2813651 RepID=A0A7C8J8D8_ORBOL|nr:hypothetical protein TWF103_004277 [Orbilia oligospora]KAF3102003.1 hypothetical protein TWF102_004732 [Orbilia oligospora]KAF3125842.1 hypothetical protein TWF703_010662 [Orbilia oligospora]KAF3132125.1 hypothetical protein TWF569_010995 [Orbilia oligospora]KAF3144497.1 hypothetical protein TWF594_004662 [Orbilia oligospora]
MDIDDSFTRELEESSMMSFEDPTGHHEVLPDLDMDMDLDDNDHVNVKSEDPGDRFRSSVADEEAREAALRAELESVRKVNRLIVAVNKSLQTAMENMGTVNQAVDNANFLLDKYSQILSQSTHTSRIILNGHWKGSSNDVAEMEEEAQTQALEAERRRIEEEEAAIAREREARAREAAVAAQVTAAATRGTRGGRGTGRKTTGSRGTSSGYGRPSSTTSTGASTSSSSTSQTTRGTRGGSGLARYSGRPGSGIGRGIPRGTSGTTRGTRGT